MGTRKSRASPRKQPKQERASVTVDAILAASAQTLRERGFAKASVNAIARRAGVSVGSLYQYYPSKDALLVALAERHTAEALATLERTFLEVREEPLEVAVRAVVERMVAAHADPLHQVLALGLDEVGAAPSIQAAIDERAGAAVTAFLIERAGQVRTHTPALTALLVVRAIDLLTHAAIERYPQSIGDGTLATELSALALGYLRA
ncbi:MAG: TetR/AcrR family transcriptional regulator [Polyangiaceae bacterium]